MKIPPFSPAQLTVRFGWNRQHPPAQYHWIADEQRLSDVFEGINAKEDLRKHGHELTPSSALLDRVQACFENQTSPKNNRLFVLDIPNSLGIGEVNVSNFLSDLFIKAFERLKTIPPNKNEALAYRHGPWRIEDGIFAASSLNGQDGRGGPAGLRAQRRADQPVSSLHWDVAPNQESGIMEKGVLRYLSFLHGKRENMQDTSGLSMYSDFTQWYQDQHFEKPLQDLTEEELADLVLAHAPTLEKDYTITLPAHKDSTRFTIFLQSPQHGGLLHGVTPLKVVESDKPPQRELLRRFIFDKDYLIRRVIRENVGA